MIKNIILDVGKVLVAWQPQEAMRELGIVESAVKTLEKGLFDSGIWNEVDRGVLNNDEFLELAFRQVPECKAQIQLFWDNVDKAIWQLPYARAWIRAMKKAGYHVYILSNYGEWTYEKTKDALSFLEDVDGAVFSYRVKRIKPEPAIFHCLFDKYNLKPEECVFLDDLATNIAGAQAVGMHGIVFTGLEEALVELQRLGINIEE